jgi:hypothetical protein
MTKPITAAVILGLVDDGVLGLDEPVDNVPDQDLAVVVLTQRAADETGLPAVCDEILAAARVTP